MIPTIDLAVMDFMNNIANPFLDFLMPKFSLIGNLGAVWICWNIFLLANKHTRTLGIAMAMALILTLLTGELLLKNIIARERPFVRFPEITLLINTPVTFSFPSGHAASSFAALGMLFKLRYGQAILSLALALLISFSRVYLSVHFFTDVLGGCILGLLCAFTVLHFCKRKGIMLYETSF